MLTRWDRIAEDHRCLLSGTPSEIEKVFAQWDSRVIEKVRAQLGTEEENQAFHQSIGTIDRVAQYLWDVKEWTERTANHGFSEADFHAGKYLIFNLSERPKNLFAL